MGHEITVAGTPVWVDFHWEVDGQEYDFSIPGGGFVSFTDLVEVLGIAGSEGAGAGKGEEAAKEAAADAGGETALTLDGIEISDETRKFVEGVEKVEFSSPELVWVGKAEEDTTVGQLKKEQKLDVEYSAELTEEQIDQINGTSVSTGDWALISLKAFDTEESLTVTMKNGEVVTIKVTDANSNDSLGLDNDKEYVIGYNNGSSTTILNKWSGNGYWGATQNWNGEDYEYTWFIEYDTQSNKYYIKNSDNQYISMPSSGDNKLVSNKNQATAFTITKSGNTYQFTYTYRNQYWQDITSYLTCQGSYFNMGGSSTNQSRLTLYEKPEVQVDEKLGDWLLYLDEDLDEITIHVGETITLRPYDEWTWKENAVQNKYWNVELPSGLNWTISGTENDGSNMKTWTESTGMFRFTRFVKYDDQLETRYWSLQGRALKTGEYILTNSANNHQIKVKVVDGDPVNKPSTVKNTINSIKVNLFNYDKDHVLDPSNDSNIAGSVNESNINKNHNLDFLSSGRGNQTKGNINGYTKDEPNPNLVNDTLDNGYPKLRK